MYYIVNQDKQIIAADADFLSLLEIESLQELFVQVASGRISFEETGTHTLEITVAGSDTLTLDKKSYPLTTLVGDLLLNEISEPEEAEETVVEEKDNTISGFDTLPDEEMIDFIKPEEEPAEEEAEEEEEEETIGGEMVEDIIELAEPEPEPEPEEEEIDFLKTETEEVEEEQVPIAPRETEEEEYTVVTEDEDTINLLPDEELTHPKPGEGISIDAETISKTLGISKEDYTEFLNEFIDKAIEEEKAVKDTNSPEHQKAVTSLHKLSQMLHLTALSEILETIIAGTGEKSEKAVEDFYHTLSGMTTAAKTDEVAPETTETKQETYAKAICQLSLDDVKPIHFDFQPQQASDELGLPLELIIEFTHDFIAQAHEEEETFRDACEKGDIDTIHKTAHKLKGVASNLRIVPLAETLEELQFSEDTSRFEPLLKKYWGQFLTLENLMNTISNKKGGK